MSMGTDNLLDMFYGELRKEETKVNFREMIKSAVQLEKYFEEKKLLNPMYYDIYGQGTTKAMYEDKQLHELFEKTVDSYKKFLGYTDKQMEQTQTGVYNLLYLGFKSNGAWYAEYKSLHSATIINTFLREVYGYYVRVRSTVKALGEEIEFFEEKVAEYGENVTQDDYIEVATNYIYQGYTTERRKFPKASEKTRLTKLIRLLNLNYNRAWYGQAFLIPSMVENEEGKFSSFGCYLENHLVNLRGIHTILDNEMTAYRDIYIEEKKAGFEADDSILTTISKNYDYTRLPINSELPEEVEYLSEAEQEIIKYGYTYEPNLYDKYGNGINVMKFETEVGEIKEKVDLILHLLKRNHAPNYTTTYEDAVYKVDKYLGNKGKLTVQSKVMLLHHQLLLQIGCLLEHDIKRTKQYNNILFYLIKVFDVKKQNGTELNPHNFNSNKLIDVEAYKEKLWSYHKEYRKGNTGYEESIDELIDIINGQYW